MSKRSVAVFIVLGPGLTGCDGAPTPTPARASTPAPAPASAATRSPEGLRVPEAVAKQHRSQFDSTREEAKLGPVICFVTLHDAALGRGEFFSLVLFASGSVGTWRQTPKGAEEPFYAELTPQEQAKAAQELKEIPAGRALAKETFDPGVLVMGVSTRTKDHRVETLYFDNRRLPGALGELVGMLKARLEATNAPSP